ncbi:hypothetical protein YC2023_012582 [Brassica napus]
MNTSVLVRTSISTHDFGIGITRAPHLFLAFYPLEGLSNYHSAAELLVRLHPLRIILTVFNNP